MSKAREQEGSCRLCLSVSPLRRSHVVPKFLYRTLRDETHSFAAISNSGSIVPLQDGIREEMLCGSCEAKLQKWEDSAARTLRRMPDMSMHRAGHVEKVKGVDYATFRLFCLSILWRSSVSSNPLFSEVHLEEHETIRLALLKADPLERLDYPVLFIRPCGAGAYDQYFWPPTAGIKFSHVAYNFFMAGMYWVFFVCRQRSNSLPDFDFHSPANELPVYVCSQDIGKIKKACIQELAAVGITQDQVGRYIQKRQRRGG